MYGQPPHFSRRGGGRGQSSTQQPPQPLINPNYFHNNYYLQAPSFPINFPDFPVENPNIHTQNFNLPIGNPNFDYQNFSFNLQSQLANNRVIQHNGTIEKIDKAVAKARRELITAGENVSALKVSQAALLILQVDSWDSLGVQMQHVPSLYRLMLIEGKINAFINCFVGVWKITTLYDLEAAICNNEGVEEFEELELGPLFQHPLINHYFCVSSDSVRTYKISGQDILTYLVEFMDANKGAEIKADELLDFIAENRAVDSKEKLHVRIQSLGLHISFIKQARPSEIATLKKYLPSSTKKNEKHPLFTSQKKQLDEKFSTISQRINSFSSEYNKHIRFHSSGSEEEDDVIESDDEDEICLTSQTKNSTQDMKSSDRVSSCPYPSAIEEKTRLGILTEKEISPPHNKHIRFHSSSSEAEDDDNDEDETCLTSQTKKSTQDMKTSDLVSSCPYPSVNEEKKRLSNEKVNKLNKKRKSDEIDCESYGSRKNPKNGSMGIKISKKVRYKHKHQADMSLDHDSVTTFITLWKDACKRKDVYKVMKQMIKFYKPDMPDIPIKLSRKLYKSYPLVGLINVAIKSIKDTFEQEEEPETDSKGHTGNVNIETEKPDSRLVSKQHCEVEILRKIGKFLDDNHDVSSDFSSSLGKNALFIRNLYKCEVWLTEQFDVENFESFGYCDFLTFLERNFSALPHSFHKYFVVDDKDKPSLEASMSHQLLQLLVAQASHSLLENENLSIQNVEELLTKQFPLIPFKLDIRKDSLEDVVNANKSIPVSKSVVFSAALFSFNNVKSETHFSSKDAIEVLLKAPMLTDLNTWSQWDVLFAPSLGPLTLFLLNEINTKELLCLVTRIGNVIRIDHTATLDSFLEASINMSSVQTSLNLLSLLALYGGEKNIPLSLLKCHAEKAFKVIVNNDLSKDNGISSASKFVLECLTFLPREFRCFATDLLLTGFRSVVKDPSSAILRECRHVEEHLMLHELGLSLGIMEWTNDYNSFSLTELSKSSVKDVSTSVERKEILLSSKDDDADADVEMDECKVVNTRLDLKKPSNNEEESAKIIECIRREEFGLDPDISAEEDNILKKQHARLGRALHCLSQELYSQDSHFLLELVQNADDNVYPCDVEPTLTFILKEEGVIVLNNEQGFSVENIKALCDVGNSTKKEANAGYIGKKGIGFKSVFRVTNAPEIHSNGFHIKFDISDGQIGFVLPTVVPPCDVNLFSKLASVDNDPADEKHWNTCIVLPFRSKKTEAENLISMFSDLHPSLLLFLHRLECIKFRNLLDDSFTVMRKQIVGDGIVNVTLGKNKMNWFVKSRKLQADHIRSDVQTTEISMALMLEDLDNGNYIQKLEHQPVFAFLPLRNYGLKFIIQADFTLPSSREEVDGDSPWNQWLLSEFPNLFVTAELAFCSLPCFKKNPAKGISVFMSFVPLGAEVHGFFSCLPRMIISKLRVSNCLLLEGDINEWVPPCKVVRNWTEQVRSLLPDNLIKEHLGVGYLNKHTVLTDSLARALGIEECGPKILVQVMTSLCRAGSLKSMGLIWLSSWLNVLYLMLVNETQSDIITSLSQLPFVPLLDGKYTSVDEGAIWLHTDSEHGLEACGKLYSNLRIVNPVIFNDSPAENITQMLYKVGVQRLSAHEVLKVHILPAISDTTKSKELMIEYLTYIMLHLDSPCTECCVEREHILTQLHNNAFISTNRGYKRLVDVPIHFSREFGNPIDMNKLIYGSDITWFEIDIGYLKHPVFKSSPEGTLKWRKFFQDLGITDFVQIVKVENHIKDISHTNIKKMMLDDECMSSGSIVTDWDSQELTNLLSHVLSTGDREKSKYLLEVVDTLWDDYLSDKVRGFCIINGEKKPFKSSVIRILNSVRWLASSMDDQLHFPKDLFHNCEMVLAVVGETAPYVIPKIKSVKLLNDIGLKDTITLDDALSLLQVWTRSDKPFKASISQMSKFYTYIWNEMSISKQKIVDNLHSEAFIYVPYSFGIGSAHEVVSGSFLSPNEVYWHDSIGSMEQTKSTHFSKMLCNIYPSLRYFFVKEFGVGENPPLLSYLQSLVQLSTGTLPSQAAKTVFKVFLKWSDGLESGVLSCEDIDYLKKSMEEKEMKILPTVHDEWVSLHQSLCWCNDDNLKKEFKNVNFLLLGELNTQEKQKLSVLLHKLGIPSLSEVVTREAIYYGPTDSSYKTSLVSWALPYAQRYIYSIHPNEYYSEFRNLKIVVVEKLFYKNIIKKFGIQSNKRHESTCLLQDNVLYATRESDTHSLFMELSRFLLPKIPQLHLANFLHMITTMAESGSTEEQMEFFITNNQKLLKLPNEESQWAISMSALEDGNDPPTNTSLDDLNPPKPYAKKFGNNSSWPPVNWKTAPGFEYASKTKAFNNNSQTQIETDADWIMEESCDSTIPAVILEEDEASKRQLDSGICTNSSVGFNVQSNFWNVQPNGPNLNASSSSLMERDQLNWAGSSVTPQQVITGRTGEYVAYKYFSEKLVDKCVKWVNEVKESGLPFDIIVEGEDNSKEYIEVKATSNARKDWFVITIREWQFAVEQGDSFSIARVVMSHGNLLKITTYKNPLKLCQSGHLQLAIIPSN